MNLMFVRVGNISVKSPNLKENIVIKRLLITQLYDKSKIKKIMKKPRPFNIAEHDHEFKNN